MTKAKNQYLCQECGAVSNKWAGQCNDCGSWGSVVEENTGSSFKVMTGKSGNILEFASLDGKVEDVARTSSKISELDRVLGGGLVPGSAILIGGDPGIGKSTILLQAAASICSDKFSVAYISGEESMDQVRLRARRLGLEKSPVKLLSATSVKDIITSVEKNKDINLLIIDSIQTMFVDSIASAPGTVSQVRASAYELISVAKKKNIALVLVGHVTKEGQIAGPKVLEHMVDTVLYFEGERGHQFRILRAVKNRFGPANEIGVFEMREEGLEEVKNPSALFLSERGGAVSGSTVFAGMEGTRPVLVEIQALIAPSMMATPRRAVVGWDSNRLAMIIAILSARFGLSLMDKEVYLNVAGGLKVNEPAADLAVAAALISVAYDRPLPDGMVLFGELGLSGEVRMVAQADIRIKEAEKLGFKSAIVPAGLKYSNKSFNLSKIMHIKELTDFFKK